MVRTADLVLDVFSLDAAKCLPITWVLPLTHTQHGVVGMMADKDMTGVLAPLAKAITRWYLTPYDRCAVAVDQLRENTVRSGRKRPGLKPMKIPAVLMLRHGMPQSDQNRGASVLLGS